MMTSTPATSETASLLPSIRVCVTGAAGQIAYSLLSTLVTGAIFGTNQPIILSLLDITPMMDAVRAVVLELEDLSAPLLVETIVTDNALVAFQGVDVALLIGAMPRREGMQRKDLLKANAAIFKVQGEALDAVASREVKVLVVGNPANTNCYLAKHYAPNLPAVNFTALTRLDENRARYQIAHRLKVSTDRIRNVIIWGNHSNTQYPDISQAALISTKASPVPIRDAIADDAYLQTEFIKTVQVRGATVLAARKLSSAMSAAKAVADHMRDWWLGSGDRLVSMAVFSQGAYGLPEDLVYSLPCRCTGRGQFEIVTHVQHSPWASSFLEATRDELLSEQQEALTHLAQTLVSPVTAASH